MVDFFFGSESWYGGAKTELLVNPKTTALLEYVEKQHQNIQFAFPPTFKAVCS